MSELSKYREVWVAEDSDGRPLKSAIRENRLNGKDSVFRYVPADAVASAFHYLELGRRDDALRVLCSLLRDGNP